MSLKPKHEQGSDYAGAVTGGVEEGTRQNEVEVKGGSRNYIQEDAGRDLDPGKGDDGNRGRDLELTSTEVSQQFRDQAIGDKSVDLPRGARANMMKEEAGRYLGPVKGDDGNMGKGLALTTEVSQQFGDVKKKYEVHAYFGQWFNSKIRDVTTNLATVEFIGSNDVADIIDGDDVAADVPVSTLKPFGPFAVNMKRELTTPVDNPLYHGVWKVEDLCVVKWFVDKCWNNAKILHIFSKSEIFVFFTEIGSANYVLFKSEPNGSAFLKTILKNKSDETNNNEMEAVNRKKQVSFALYVIVNTFEKM